MRLCAMRIYVCSVYEIADWSNYGIPINEMEFFKAGAGNKNIKSTWHLFGKYREIASKKNSSLFN